MRATFENSIRKVASGCWEWTGPRNEHGYGLISQSGRRIRAHRAAYEQTHGPIPSGALICHTCDNPPCCNPEHLWAGSMADNMRDAAAKMRFPKQHKTHCKSGHEYTSANT